MDACKHGSPQKQETKAKSMNDDVHVPSRQTLVKIME